MQAAHEILSDPQQKAKYDADRARQEKAAREVVDALRRNAASARSAQAPPVPPRRATTGARGTPFPPAAGRGRPPPVPQQPPSSGPDKYAAFTRVGAQQQDRAEQEAQKAKFDAMRGFRSMKNAQSQAFPSPQPPLRSSGHPTAPRPDINTPSARFPPRHQRSYEQFQNTPQPQPQPGFPGMSRTQGTRKPAGWTPTTPSDEPMAQRTSAYVHHTQEQRREPYFPDDDIPSSPKMARHEPATSPLRHRHSSTGLDNTSRHPRRPELERLSTRYAQSTGEKTYVNGVGRSASVRNSPVEREWEGHEGHEDHVLHRPHASSTRHRSASPNFRPASLAHEFSSSESESSADTGSDDLASRPKATPRSRRQKAGTGTFGFRHVAADDANLHSQFPPPSHKHAHSPQEEYTARYVYPPPPPRSGPRVFQEVPPFQSNGNVRMDDTRQAHPDMYGPIPFSFSSLV